VLMYGMYENESLVLLNRTGLAQGRQGGDFLATSY
jgi:hypothetical protein